MKIYNKITLTFPDKDEKLFQERYFFDSLLQVRVAFVLVAFLYAIFGYLDSVIFPDIAKMFHLIRYAFVIPIFTLVLVLSYTKLFHKIWQGLLFLSTIAGGLGVSVMIFFVPENYLYYAGMMLIFSACYFFIKLRFLFATIAGWSVLLIYNLGIIFYADFPADFILNTNFFFISANIIGMFAAYNIEYYARRNFILNLELDKEKKIVEDINKNLENKVLGRTLEMQKAKEVAEKSDQLKSAFLANMSHEIRTPMNGIMGFAKLLKEPNLKNENQQKYIQIIEKSGLRMLNIINNIVDISKIEAGLMKVNAKPSNLNQQLDYICTFFRPDIEAKGMTLISKCDLPDSESMITTDREKVFSIFTNLVKNAIEYSDEGAIEIGYVVKDQKIEFYVKDKGIGIPEFRQKAIFERFIQSDIENKMARQGAGLGLSISKAYVDMLDGNIWVESEEGVGSTFYFTLPYQVQAGKNAKMKEVSHSPIEVDDIQNMKILVAEDDEASEILLSLIVQDFAKEILVARTGLEAVDLAKKNPDVNLILMDIQMPYMNGYEATRRIRRFNKEVIIVAQTAFALSGDNKKSIEAGCNEYTTKPIIKENLIAIIAKYFKNKEGK